MSTVHAFPLPEVLWYDWALIFIGLGTGVGFVFEIINLLTVDSKEARNRLYTLANFWLILSGVIHCWIEFNMVFARSTSSIKTTMDVYAAADYRYGDYGGGMMESGTVAMEAITALFVGPLCFLVAFGATHNLSYRHPLQIVLCTCQLYGLAWFTLQPIFSDTGLAGHFSSDPVLFWVVAVGCNAPWAIFPTILLIQSFQACVEKMK
jgi:cholestenol delta-isomerase